MKSSQISDFFAVKKKSNVPTVVRLRRKGGIVVQDCDVYIGRECYRGGWSLPRSKWYNPFSVKSCGTNQKACKKYENYIKKKPELLNCLHELSGKRLGCWCKPKDCHGDVLVKLYKERVGKKRKRKVDNDDEIENETKRRRIK
jgi:hypothetical protein